MPKQRRRHVARDGCTPEKEEPCLDRKYLLLWVAVLAAGWVLSCAGDSNPQPTCESGTFKQCTTGDNIEGVQSCEGGFWGACTTTGTCADGSHQACANACGTGQEVCVNGTWQNCTAPQPQPEVCDGIDNNCNSTIDEGCGCIHGATQELLRRSRADPQGRHLPGTAAGSATRAPGAPAWARSCRAPRAAPTTSTTTVTAPSTTAAPAGRGPSSNAVERRDLSPGLADVPHLRHLGPCTGGVTPVVETQFGCDGLDNDCDGVLDNGLSPDAGEVNDTCPQARGTTITDADGAPTEFNYTILPARRHRLDPPDRRGDRARLCSPGTSECHYIDLELVQPQMTGVAYQYTLYQGSSCANLAPVATSQTTSALKWDGRAAERFARLLIKIEPISTSSPKHTCKPYTLRVLYSSAVETCP